MAAQNKIEGVWTALATPFHQDGSIDYTAWERMLHFQKEAGIDGIVVAGSTGEGATLSVTEKLALVKKARATLSKDLRIMGGVGSNDTAHCVELARLYEDAGVDCLLVVTPPYSKPNLAGLKLHFSSIGEKARVPLCLYHVPGRTAQRLDPSMLSELCKFPYIEAVKEASGDLALFSEAVLTSDANYLSGDDLTFLGSLVYGGRGVISVISNIFPKAWVKITQAFWNGDMQTVKTLHRILSPINKNLYCESNPIPLKAALEHLKLSGSHLRAPLAPLSVSNKKLVNDLVSKAKDELKEYNL